MVDMALGDLETSGGGRVRGKEESVEGSVRLRLCSSPLWGFPVVSCFCLRGGGA